MTPLHAFLLLTLAALSGLLLFLLIAAVIFAWLIRRAPCDPYDPTERPHDYLARRRYLNGNGTAEKEQTNS